MPASEKNVQQPEGQPKMEQGVRPVKVSRAKILVECANTEFWDVKPPRASWVEALDVKEKALSLPQE